MPQCLQLHLVGKGALAGQDVLALDVAVHHDDGGCVVVQRADDHRHGRKPRQFAAAFAAVSGDQLIAALLAWPRDGRHQHAMLADALGGIQHALVVPHLEGVVPEGMQFGKGYLPHLFPAFIRAAFFGGKQVIERCQPYVSGAAFQAPTPPLSALDRPPPLCPWGRGGRYSCLPR